MTRDAQQAADAAMVEILEAHHRPGDPIVTVSRRWLRTFLANFLAGWQAQIRREVVEELRRRMMDNHLPFIDRRELSEWLAEQEAKEVAGDEG